MLVLGGIVPESTISNRREMNMAADELDRSFEDCADNEGGPHVGEKALDFIIETPGGRLLMSELAARAGKAILISQDSYQFHPG